MLRRLFGGTAAALAATVVMSTVSIGPAWSMAADESKVTVKTASVPLGAGGGTAHPHVMVEVPDRFNLINSTLTYELPADLKLDTVFGSCTASAARTVITCPQPSTGYRLYNLRVVSGPGVAVGGTTGVKVTLDADNIEPKTVSAPVRFVEAVNLAATAPGPLTAKVGTDFALPLGVRNTGTTAVHGARVNFHRLGTTRHFYRVVNLLAPSPVTYSNCLYDRFALPTSCTFAQDLEPGAQYRAELPLRAEADAPIAQPYEFSQYWMTKSLDGEPAADLPPKPGTGGVLTLTKATTQTKADSNEQVDANPDDSGVNHTLTVNGHTIPGRILAPIVTSPLSGKAGDEVTATVGFRNATQYDIEFLYGMSVGLTFTLPPGVTLTAPSSCEGGQSAGVYECSWGYGGSPGAGNGSDQVRTLGPGASRTFTFTMRIDRVIPNAKGSVKLIADDIPADVGPPTDLVLNPTVAVTPSPSVSVAPTGTPTTTPPGTTPPGGAGGGTNDGDNASGDLPLTGPMAGLVGGIGILLVAAGAAGVIITRRRKTRFVA